MNATQSEREVNVRIYTKSEHNITAKKVDRDTIDVIKRLRRRNYKAYVVGGAVRDMLLDIKPKDYDIVTDATPPQIRRLFPKCKIIGKRFRLAHVYVGAHKIIEVATFRSRANINSYGKIEEDALRRDFTSNALYYDVQSHYLIDYVHGYRHINARKLVPVLPVATIFKEDPVRMVRALKYAKKTGSALVKPLSYAIRRDAYLITTVSRSRITEECLKIISSGHAEEIFLELQRYKLLQFIQPQLALLMRGKHNVAAICAALRRLDAQSVRDRPLTDRIYAYLRLFNLDLQPLNKEQRMQLAKSTLAPMMPPNSVVFNAVERIYESATNTKGRR